MEFQGNSLVHMGARTEFWNLPRERLFSDWLRCKWRILIGWIVRPRLSFNDAIRFRRLRCSKFCTAGHHSVHSEN